MLNPNFDQAAAKAAFAAAPSEITESLERQSEEILRLMKGKPRASGIGKEAFAAYCKLILDVNAATGSQLLDEASRALMHGSVRGCSGGRLRYFIWSHGGPVVLVRKFSRLAWMLPLIALLQALSAALKTVSLLWTVSKVLSAVSIATLFVALPLLHFDASHLRLFAEVGGWFAVSWGPAAIDTVVDGYRRVSIDRRYHLVLFNRWFDFLGLLGPSDLDEEVLGNVLARIHSLVDAGRPVWHWYVKAVAGSVYYVKAVFVELWRTK